MIGIGRDRLRQRDVDFADVIARDRLGLGVREFAGIDGLLDRDHAGAAFPRAEPDQDRSPFDSGLSCSQKIRARIRRVSRGRGADMGDDVAALDEQFAVERDADRTSGALAAR